ncbi:MAG: two-component sensor histidine kinase, partial [Firmicutes bacterium]|nr:two-component sensor histidine kinase [Bacillota bacterium]
PWEGLVLNDLADEVLGATKPLLERRGILLVYDPDPHLPAVRGDREKLKQVFFNLVLNAVEAMGPGGRLTVRTFAEGGSSCALVADTGAGIPPEDLPHIFKPYYSRKAGGSGLGLAISEEVVRVHGGVIRVCSRPGGGTAFTVCLPALNWGKDGEGTDGTHSDR